MRYLLDTCAVSDFIKGNSNTLSRIKKISPAQLAISVVTLMEIHYGLLKNRQHAEKIRQVITDFISCISILQFTEGEALQSATIRASLNKNGTPIGSYDILIAGTALQNDLILVTSNTKEFKRVPQLIIEDWRISDSI